MIQLLDTASTPCATSPPPAFVPDFFGDQPRATPERSKVEQTVDYMANHLTESLSVNQLASVAHVSPSHYFAIFKRQTGYAPIDFLIHLRMFRGCVLLDRTSLAVKEIAAALGYEDAFYFSRLFKRVSEVSPRAYRLLPAPMRENIRARILPFRRDAIRLPLSLHPWGRTRSTTAVSH
jgi:AraC-like DNA-binding protein